MHEPAAWPFSDAALAKRLEWCEGNANARIVEARQRIAPDVQATWIHREGAYAMFDGVGSPLTQTFGLGLSATPSDEDLDALETFFHERGADVFHEVSPISGPETLQRLVGRGYEPVELTSVLYQPLDRSPRQPRASDIRTRIISPDEVELWAETAAAGWGAHPDLSAFIRDLGRVSASASGSSPFIAELEGRAIATGALVIHDGVALLAGASTIPDARNLGAQRALLEARLHHAAERGCDLAMMCAAPGSTSQRNAERRGFRIAYTRIKFHRP